MVGVLGEGDVQAGKRERTAMAVLRRTEFTTAAVRKARPRCSMSYDRISIYTWRRPCMGEVADWKTVVPREKSRRVRKSTNM